MKNFVGRAAVLMLMALTAACSRQVAASSTSDNSLVSDETSDGNAAAFDSSLDGSLDANAALSGANAQ